MTHRSIHFPPRVLCRWRTTSGVLPFPLDWLLWPLSFVEGLLEIQVDWDWDGMVMHGPWHPWVQISSTILRSRMNSLTMGSDSCIPGGCHMDLHYRYEWRCFAVWLGCKWVSQYFIYFPSELKFYWPFTLWTKIAGWINHPSIPCRAATILSKRYWDPGFGPS